MGQAILDKSEIDKLPLGYTSFSEIKNDGVIYVDKTDLVSDLGRLKATPVFLSRPRRFGKSLLLSTFESLFSRGLKDFENLKIIKNDLESKDKFWHNEKTYKVIHLDFSRIALKDVDEFESFLTIRFHLELRGKNAWELTEAEKSVSYNSLLDSYSKENRGKDLVLLIDEYDSPITHSVDNPQKMKEMMDAVSSFFATIKSCEGMFRFVCITGVTRLAHVSLFSMFNNLEDITVNDKYSALLGITEDELHEYFDTYVQNAAAVLDMSVSDVYARLKSTYNGFQFAINAQRTVYNPWSIISFLKKPKQGFLNYWYSTSGGVPTMLVKYLQQEDNLELFNILRSKVASQNIEVEEDEDLWVDRDELMAKSEPDQIPIRMLLYQSGCFTLKGVDRYLAKLVIPNDEVGESMIRLALDIKKLRPRISTKLRLNRLTQVIDSHDVEEVFNLFNTVLLECVSANSKAFSDENTIRDIIYALIPRDDILKSKEVMNSQGFSDLELKTRQTKLVIEFKRIAEAGGEDKVIEDAFTQMRTRHYGETTEPQKLIRAAMVISTGQRRLVAWRVMPDSAPADGCCKSDACLPDA